MDSICAILPSASTVAANARASVSRQRTSCLRVDVKAGDICPPEFEHLLPGFTEHRLALGDLAPLGLLRPRPEPSADRFTSSTRRSACTGVCEMAARLRREESRRLSM